MSTLQLGTCGNCKFAEKIPTKKNGAAYDHWRAEFHKYFCKRFPPTPAISRGEIWAEHSTVNDTDGCWEFKSKEH